MTTEEKYKQILAILPKDNQHISVEHAPLCNTNPWCEHSISEIWYDSKRGYICYRTISNIPGHIDIYDECQGGEYKRDVEVLWLWMVENEFFGRYDHNLF